MGDAGNAIWDAIAPFMGDPVGKLAAQVNRFGAAAPAGYQYAATPFVATGNLDPNLALVALTIYQARATSAYAQFHDQGSAQAIAAANAGFADPTGFVQSHISDVTQQIAGFADSLGLPPAAGDDVGDNTTLWVVGGAMAAYFLFAKKRGRR